jgi:hypothetical protein
MLVLKRRRAQTVEFTCRESSLTLTVREIHRSRGRCELELASSEDWPLNPPLLRLGRTRDQFIKAPCGDIRVALIDCTSQQVLIGLSAPADCTIRRPRALPDPTSA